MAARHEIVHIDFQANAGKANAALQALQNEASKARDKVTQLRNDLQNAKATNLPTDQIQKLEAALKKAETESRQWQQALQNNMKGVRALDEAIKMFNNGKGSVEGMSAALSKAARNAAQLQQSREVRGSQTWKEMESLIIALDKNIIKANLDITNLVANVQNGGKTTKAALSLAKTDLEQLMTMTVRGSKEWNTYNKQLKVVVSELNMMADAEKKAAKADQTAMMTKRMKDLGTMSASSLGEVKRFWEQMISDAEKGSAAMARYEANLKRVKAEEQKRTAVSAGQVLGNMDKYGVEQIRKSVQEMTLLRDSLKEGSKEWVRYNSLIQQGSAYLKEYDEREKIARGDALSLADALKIASSAGGKGFTGTAKELKQAEEALQKAAAAAKKGSPEWQKYQDALAKVRVEMQNTGITSERMRQILDKPANAKNLNELSAAVKRAKAELDLMAETVGKDSAAYRKLADSTKQAEVQLKALQAQSHGTATSFDKAWSRLKTYIGLYMGAAVAIQKLTATMGDIMELSDKMGEVRKTTGFTADEVGRLSENLKKMDVRTPLTQLMDVAAAAGQLGLKSEKDVQGFAEAANKLMIALPEMGKEAATEMMRVAIATGEVEKIRKQLQEGTIEGSSATAVAMEKIASTIDRLRASSASTAPEITDFVKRVGAVGAQSGITIDQVSALGSTISSIGMRVEMSATALSRMIPAIKNNAFDLARAIGVTPDTIRNLFDTGRGMEAILMILQHMKDAGMDEDSIEAMMGMGGMRDIMKDLNQQGARAGIVFAGLSQNVDELRRQLGIANQAYEENIAIQQEFDKMNDTTAAKWERFKNQIEEMFVSDSSQRFFGTVIEGLRAVADFISSDGPIAKGLKYILILWASFKIGVGQALLVNLPKLLTTLTTSLTRFFTVAITGLGNLAASIGIVTARTRLARMEWAKMDLAMKQNIWGLVIAAVVALTVKLYQWRKSIAEARKEWGEMAKEMVDAEEKVKENFKAVNKANAAIAIATTKLAQARKALEEAKKAMDGSKESAEKLAKAEKNLKKAEDDLKIAQDGRRAAIENINKLYNSYLGFLLSETARYQELEIAIGLVNNKLREGIILRRKEAAVNKVESENGEKREEKYGDLAEFVRGLRLSKGKIKEKGKDGKTTTKETLVANAKENEKLLTRLTKLAQSDEFAALDVVEQYNRVREALKDTRLGKGGYLAEGVVKRTVNYAKQFHKVNQKIKDVEAQYDVMASVEREESQEKLTQQYNEGLKTYEKLQETYTKSTGEAKKKAAANLLKQADSLQSQIAAAPNYYDLTNADEKVAYEKFIKDSQARLDKINEQRDNLLKEAGTFYSHSGGGGGGGNYNPWGNKQEAESTNYADMNAEQLVNRRKQMKDFVNAIQTDSDVKAVLAEDKALQKAIQNGMASDMRTVINWYNTERLKIQDELHSRFLTNTGDWMDPKKQKNAHKQFKAELDAYLEELDAYYTERKTRIQEARVEEGISEAEVQNRTIANDTEWHQRRAELLKLYTNRAVEVSRKEQEEIYAIIAERTGDTVEFIEKQKNRTVKFADDIAKSGQKGAAMVHKWIADIGLKIEREYLKQQQDLMKQMDAIEAIIDKERPFNGITKNLRENLVTMGLLTADMSKERDELMRKGEDMTAFNERQAAEELKRTVFLLGEAENAWSLTIEDVMRHMAEKGMTAWAKEISSNEKGKEAMMAQLRSTYDAIQDAIKKEASLMKKQAEIMWNNILLPGGDGKTTIKDAFEKSIAQLVNLQGRVSRANSLIGAGQASERVADKLAIKQMQLQLTMQTHYYNLMRKQGQLRIDMLDEQIKKAKLLGEIEKANRLEMDKEHAEMSLRLATTKEQVELDKQREDILARVEESQARLYKELREWGDLITTGLRGVMEASNAGNEEYYNELAKMKLTGKGGPGAGTYIIIENEGTEDAVAHYEYLDERAALERQHQIEQDNARAEAWRKVMDDINNKMAESITDWMNAYLQNQSIDANTNATRLNTDALGSLTDAVSKGLNVNVVTPTSPVNDNEPAMTPEGEFARGKQNYSEFLKQTEPGSIPGSIQDDVSAFAYGKQNMAGGTADQAEISATNANTQALNANTLALGGEPADMDAATEFANGKQNYSEYMKQTEPAALPEGINDDVSAFVYGKQNLSAGTEVAEGPLAENTEALREVTAAIRENGGLGGGEGQGGSYDGTLSPEAQQEINENNIVTETKIANKKNETKTDIDENKKQQTSTQSTFAKMTQAANLYGVAYQAMSNDNLDTAQKFEMIALQAVGNAAIAGLQVALSSSTAQTAANMPAAAAKSSAEEGPIAGPILFAILSALVGGLMGLAASKVAKSKSQISQVTGASVSAGRMSTGMLTYAEGNVNEFTDPNTLTPGRHYNVDAADGKTYRAKYTGRNPKTHITNGPEFHLSGEAGREAIIDARTTRLIQMDDNGIWKSIQALYNGGSLRALRRRSMKRGIPAFADGNLDDFEEMTDAANITGTAGIGIDQLAQFQSSIDKNNELLERALTQGIRGVFDVYGKGGLIDSYDTGKRTVTRHGESY